MVHAYLLHRIINLKKNYRINRWVDWVRQAWRWSLEIDSGVCTNRQKTRVEWFHLGSMSPKYHPLEMMAIFQPWFVKDHIPEETDWPVGSGAPDQMALQEASGRLECVVWANQYPSLVCVVRTYLKCSTNHSIKEAEEEAME